MLLKNLEDARILIDIVKKCKGDVFLRSIDGAEEFNLKSTLSQYMAISKLCADHGNEYEICCADENDEVYMMQFFVRCRNND